MDTDYIICLERANEFVKAAKLCLDKKYPNAAATRAYYGALHAGVAALGCYTQDLKVWKLLDGKVHEKTPAEFDRRFTKKSDKFKKQNGILHILRGRRDDADYKISGVTKSKASDSVAKAQSFLNDITERMKKDGHDTGNYFTDEIYL